MKFLDTKMKKMQFFIQLSHYKLQLQNKNISSSDSTLNNLVQYVNVFFYFQDLRHSISNHETFFAMWSCFFVCFGFVFFFFQILSNQYLDIFQCICSKLKILIHSDGKYFRLLSFIVYIVYQYSFLDFHV